MEISVVQSLIHTHTEQGRAIRLRIAASSGPDRHALWNEKRAVGRRTRYLLLLYGCLRGIPYRRIEPRCHQDNGAQPLELIAAAQSIGLVAGPKTEAAAPADAIVRAFRAAVTRDPLPGATGWILELERSRALFAAWIGAAESPALSPNASEARS